MFLNNNMDISFIELLELIRLMSNSDHIDIKLIKILCFGIYWRYKIS